MAWRLSEGLKNALLGTASLKTILANGQIRIFAGPQPASAEDAETGPVLCVITLASGAMVSGVGTNGINMATPSGGAIGKASGEVWSGKNLATGTAGWFRWYPNAFDTNMGAAAAGNKIRLDGNVATSGGQLNLSSVSLRLDITTTIDNVNLFLP
jgi:hypothetical protein